eukprot:Seg2233.4 transcript_id=Seg2233.4/GoldUCD/mRNA.D3Y31 product="Ribosome biogenesis protein bop1" protein_id=Seg2233.4/GoldUCD/D3Y31
MTDVKKKKSKRAASAAVANDEDSDASDESYYSGLEEEDSSSENEEASSDEENNSIGSDDKFSENEEDDEELPTQESDEDIPMEPSFNVGIADESVEDTVEHAAGEKELNSSKLGQGGIVKIERIADNFEDADTSDEEEIRNTVGNIPMEWYRDYSHIGYDVRGKKIVRPAQGDELEKFLSMEDNPDFWKTVRDHTNEENIKLTDEDLEIIKNIQTSHFPEPTMDPYEPYVDWFTGDKMLHPIKDTPASKRSFMPSKWEQQRVMKIVRAIKNGWIKPKPVKDEKNKYYLLWRNEEKIKDHPMNWPAPKMKLPGHDESYNPPPEYLLSEEEVKQWEDLDPEDRRKNFIPKKYDCLRKVPGYQSFIQERFERCLDLYLCPRQRKIRLQVDPEDLIPKLPKPRDLQPFPSRENLVYRGHEGAVRCLSVDPSGQWLVSGSEDKTLRFWEISTCRCVKTIKFEETVTLVEWNPNSNMCLLAAAVGKSLYIINPYLGDKLISSNTDNTLAGSETTIEDNDKISWKVPTLSERNRGLRIHIVHEKIIKQGSWHVKGDYFAVVQVEGGSQSVVIHQLTRRKSQIPFKKPGGLIQCVKFHPTKPFLFVATQTFIRVYNLQKQELVKKLASGTKWISSMAVHPQGDNLIVGSYDKRLCWFDIDLSTKPYKTLRHHKKAIQSVAFHSKYPLFASASDDGSVIVCHGKVFSDLLQNPLIVPVKIIRCHKPIGDHGVADCVFHPSQPWIFTAGADNTVKLCT